MLDELRSVVKLVWKLFCLQHQGLPAIDKPRPLVSAIFLLLVCHLGHELPLQRVENVQQRKVAEACIGPGHDGHCKDVCQQGAQPACLKARKAWLCTADLPDVK